MLEKGLEALEVKDEESRIRLTRRSAAHPPGEFVFHHAPSPANPSASAAVPAAEAVPAEPSLPTIVTPLAGVFYRASSPASASFVNAGDVVEPGQTLCIVEAMKVMNEIKAEARCRIAKIVAENGRPVSAGQTLFQIEPA
jgi:acetyl-CoA carboxylase biotin carboxyl carrier protein